MSKESEMFALITKWESSGLDQSAFCLEHGIKLSKFSYWRSRYKKTQSKQGSGDNFIRIKPSVSTSIELLYPNGVKVLLPTGTDESTLSTLIRLI